MTAADGGFAAIKAQLDGEMGGSTQEEAAGNGQGEPATINAATLDERFPRIDWAAAYATDFTEVNWALAKLFEHGQQVALPGAGKVGKSLLVLDALAHALRGLPFLGAPAPRPLTIAYFDRENSLREIITRLLALGVPPDALVGKLHYFQFPSFTGQLDAEQGARELLTLVDHVNADLVVLDTTSRYIEGKENDADTWLELYRRVHVPLKAAGRACLRLDHFGKDLDRGARGSSAKDQDVDHVWELTGHGETTEKTGGIEKVTTQLRLTRTHTRTGIGPSRLDITRIGHKNHDQWIPGRTSHTLTDAAEVETQDQVVASYVDELVARGAPLTAGRGQLKEWAAKNHVSLPGKNEVLGEVVKALKARAA